MYSISVRAKSVPELKQNIQAVLASLQGVEGVTLQNATATLGHSDSQSSAPAATEKKTRKKTETVKLGEAEKTTTVETTETKPAAETAKAAPVIAAPATDEITIEKLREVLNKVSTKKGMAESIKLLKKHGAGRISDLEKKKYSVFLDDCTAAIA